MTSIHGTFDPRFQPVRDEFIRNFRERDDVGASVAISVDGEMVVDLWGGYRNAEKTLPWEENTIVNVYSSTKTMAAMSLLVMADRGDVDLHAPVSRYWPEFAQNGKENVEVRHFLSHSAGLSGLDQKVSAEDVYDWDGMCDRLARQKPWWEPGSQSGYHALTQGFLIGEVVRRVSGRSIGQYFRTEIAEPTGADFFIGTPESEFQRIGDLIPPPAGPASGASQDSIAARTFASPAVDARDSRTAGWRKAEIPAANGHGNARSIVRAQTAMANGGVAFGKRILSAAGAARIFDVQTSGMDLVLGAPITFGMGYGLSTAEFPMGPNEHIGYWGGWGGSTVVVDQDARMCVSYVMNRMEGNLMGDPRGFVLLQAAYQSLG
ncbi:MAG: beta-lactamase family protein [Pseudomonadales bacterium]|nr:beta-lactamase family protein [Pseudomonadales bacterium]MCP5184505.1 beta-lactamase family protein [Pseudomonadales bacterium]